MTVSSAPAADPFLKYIVIGIVDPTPYVPFAASPASILAMIGAVVSTVSVASSCNKSISSDENVAVTDEFFQ